MCPCPGLENILAALRRQKKALTKAELAEAEKPVEREADDGTILLIDRQQYVEVLAVDLLDACGQPGSNRQVEAVRKGASKAVRMFGEGVKINVLVKDIHCLPEFPNG